MKTILWLKQSLKNLFEEAMIKVFKSFFPENNGKFQVHDKEKPYQISSYEITVK